MPAWEKLDDFLQTGDFADVAIISFHAGGTHTLVGIFDDPYLNAEIGEYEMDTTKPRFTCKLADVLAVRRGDSISIKINGAAVGTVYDILTGAHPDGTGMAMLELAPR